MHTSIYIDDIVVDNLLPCARPEKIKLVDYNYNSVKLSWTTPKDINQWRVLFAK